MEAIALAHVSKRYKRYVSRAARLADWIGFRRGAHFSEHWALHDVSFTVGPGEAVGIVGRNGAGKSTLLKLITGTTRPTAGAIRVNGRVAALLELGLGFDPEFTGRQNVLMNAHLLGLTGPQAVRLMPEIEAFAEIGTFLDQPLRTYSSGMQMRLAFSAATAVRPEVLIVDEALSVGDAYFQHKSFARIRDFKRQGTTILFTSHDPGAVKTLCDRAVLLEEGKLVMDGTPAAVLDVYNATIARREADYAIQEAQGWSEAVVATRSGNGLARVSRVVLVERGREVGAVPVGAAAALRVAFDVFAAVPEFTVGILIRDRLGNDVFGTNTHLHGASRPMAGAERGMVVDFAFPALNLGVGSYSVSVALHAGRSHVESNFDWWDNLIAFQVVPGDGPVAIGTSYLPVEVAWREPVSPPDDGAR